MIFVRWLAIPYKKRLRLQGKLKQTMFCNRYAAALNYVCGIIIMWKVPADKLPAGKSLE